MKGFERLVVPVIATAAESGEHFARWWERMPFARGKGINSNSLLRTDIDHTDTISWALDHCVQVKVYK